MDTDRIDQALEESQAHYPPRSITASRWSVCDRRMWLKYRDAKPERHGADKLRLFDTGHHMEALFVKWLRKAGYKVGKQQAKLKGEFGQTIAKIDGVIVEPDTGEIIITDFKTASDKTYKNILKNGVPRNYYMQLQIEMHLSDQLGSRKLYKARLFVLNKNTSEMQQFDVCYSEMEAENEYQRMHSLMNQESMPQGVKTFECNMCEFKGLCYEGELPELSCRTCANVHVEDGCFGCPFSDKLCSRHLIHPDFMKLAGHEISGANAEGLTIDYDCEFVNAPEGVKVDGRACFSSREIKMGAHKDKNIVEFAKAFGATVVENET